eukprot:1161094-Pelagomonas_calceolata.AAC.6
MQHAVQQTCFSTPGTLGSCTALNTSSFAFTLASALSRSWASELTLKLQVSGGGPSKHGFSFETVQGE